MSPTTLKSISDSQEADDICELACDLLSELLDEYQPGSEEQLQTEIEKSAPEDFSPFAQNTILLRTKFNHERQKAIGKFLKNGFIDVFLACLEHLYGNDIEAQLRACSRAGIRGKIDLTKYRRPTLSDEAILQYEQRQK
ncbi:MAG: hypothetical protein IJN19_05800 [Opitutales bacterium]|nr:hypothetical protein [Opitutales bacterium]